VIRAKFHLDLESLNEYSLEVASTKEDLEQAFGLIYEGYLENNLCDQRAEKLRCTIYQALPYTTILVAKYKGSVVGTVSLVIDSPLRIPCEKSFSEEIMQLRKDGRRMSEVIAFSVSKDHRKSNNRAQISALLMAYLYIYAKRQLKADTLICAVHPRAENFYRALLKFKRMGRNKKYSDAKNAPAIFLYQNMNEYMNWASNFPVSSSMWTLASLAGKEYESYFPSSRSESPINLNLTPELLQYFFNQKSDVFSNASRTQLRSIKRAYSLKYNLDDVPAFGGVTTSRGFRYLLDLPITLRYKDLSLQTHLRDLSYEGAFIETQIPIPEGAKFNIEFQLEGHHFNIQAQIRWQNASPRGRYNKGCGVQFISTPDHLRESIRGLFSEHDSKSSAA